MEDKIDLRDVVLRTFLEYGINECSENNVTKIDLAECAEEIVEKLTLTDVSQQRELLISFAKYMEEDKMYARHDEANVDDFLKSYSN